MPCLFLNSFLAYIGPGGGLAITFSLVTLLLGIFGIFFAYLSWPVTLLLSLLRGKRVQFRYSFRKVVVLGLDGLDPKLLHRFIEEGKLPNFQRLAHQGHFSELATTLPAMTPAAWPSFMTGNDASYHGIYDFLTPDRQNYLPKFSSYEIPSNHSVHRKKARTPGARGLRKGVPFWKTLGDHGVQCTILRVPITFPPEPFRGRLLSGLCVPDLPGTQGTFTCYTTAPDQLQHCSGEVRSIIFDGDHASPRLYGPHDPRNSQHPRLSLRFSLNRSNDSDSLCLRIRSERLVLSIGQQSEWINIRFHKGLQSVFGQVRFHLIQMQPYIVLYMSPVQITPERSAMPISHPRLFSDYLAKTQGTFGTLGFLEDTTALNEGILNEADFLGQVHKTFEERKKMFFHALDLKADDLTLCVFDTPDRVQHMFWRYLEDDHPAHQELPPKAEHRSVIERLYLSMDHLVGETLEKISDQTLLLVASDHGFSSFRREVDLNAWLHQEGYLQLKSSAKPEMPWLEAIDWSGTKAYALGLSGLFLNLRGRERHGIVSPGSESESVIRELASKLEKLQDPGLPGKSGPTPAIHRVFDTQKHFQGPHQDGAPDLIIGYAAGYRVSWASAKGQIGKHIFANNTKAWSGDHCIDPDFVPGVLLANHPLPSAVNPRLIDLPRTILDIFGVLPAAPMQGRSLLQPHVPSDGTSKADTCVTS